MLRQGIHAVKHLSLELRRQFRLGVQNQGSYTLSWPVALLVDQLIDLDHQSVAVLRPQFAQLLRGQFPEHFGFIVFRSFGHWLEDYGLLWLRLRASLWLVTGLRWAWAHLGCRYSGHLLPCRTGVTRLADQFMIAVALEEIYCL